MVICKYFQQGTCRFGNNCRFDHPRSDYGVSGESVLSRARFGAQQYAPNNYFQSPVKTSGNFKGENSLQDLEALMRLVTQEAIQSEKGKQWPLSCFAPIKERPCYPGWEDYSPEEIRWKMYEAVQNGTLPECQRKIKELYEAARLRRHNILNPNAEVYEIIGKLSQGQKIETGNTFSFMKAAAELRNNNGPTYTSWNMSGFGNNQQQTNTSSNFVFSLPQLGTSTGQPLVQQQPNVFGNNVQVTPACNVDMQPANVFNNVSEIQSPFSNVAQVPGKFISPLQVVQPSNIAHDGTKSVFNSPSVFNKNETSAVDNVIYTTKEVLSQDELNTYMAQTFTMGKVPTKPPPRELCGM